MNKALLKSALLNPGWMAILILLAGCASKQPAAVTDYGKSVDDFAFPPRLGELDDTPRTVPKTAAVAALLKEATQKIRGGELDAAVDLLERSLRIEPRNALLWSELAAVRYRQEQLDQAEQLALKSNLFAAEDTALQVYNWRLIADIRRQRGDTAQAGVAERRVLELRAR